MEDEALDSFENIKLSVLAIRRAGIRAHVSKWEVTVVTQWQHLKRFEISFWAMYGMRIKRAPLNYPMSRLGGLMEYAMIVYHFIDPHGIYPVARINRDKRRQASFE